MTDDIAKGTPWRTQHTQAPAWLGHQIQYIRQGRLRGSAQTIFNVLMALPQYLQVKRQHQGTAACRLGPVDQTLDKVAVAHDI